MNIIFDNGSVLLDNTWPSWWNKVATATGIREKRIILLSLSESSAFETGRISEREFWKRVLGDDSLIPKAMLVRRKVIKPIAGMLPLLARLKRKHTLYMLNDEPKEWMDFMKRKFNLAKYFKGIVTSSDTGICKPSLRAFRLVLKRYNLTAADTLFIDDLPENIRAAKSLRIKAILFRGKDRLKAELEGII